MAHRGNALSTAFIRQRGARTQQEIADAAGVSRDTVQAVEVGRRSNFRPSVRRALEAAVGWAEGGFEVAEAGGEPELLPEPVGGVERGFDPITASQDALGKHAQWISDTSGDPTLGDQWLDRIVERRRQAAAKDGIRPLGGTEDKQRDAV